MDRTGSLGQQLCFSARSPSQPLKLDRHSAAIGGARAKYWLTDDRWRKPAVAHQKEAYTVQRETHYADEKEPDITLISRHSGVELPIEIKVADTMSIKELEAAVVTQLCGQYLRHAPTRHGILLLVHQEPRSEGWLLEDGKTFVRFETVLERLRELARTIREQSSVGPQPIVETFDVSRVVAPGEKRRATRAKRGAAKGR